jgi:hypothetical protein
MSIPPPTKKNPRNLYGSKNTSNLSLLADIAENTRNSAIDTSKRQRIMYGTPLPPPPTYASSMSSHTSISNASNQNVLFFSAIDIQERLMDPFILWLQSHWLDTRFYEMKLNDPRTMCSIYNRAWSLPVLRIDVKRWETKQNINDSQPLDKKHDDIYIHIVSYHITTARCKKRSYPTDQCLIFCNQKPYSLGLYTDETNVRFASGDSHLFFHIFSHEIQRYLSSITQ